MMERSLPILFDLFPLHRNYEMLDPYDIKLNNKKVTTYIA